MRNVNDVTERSPIEACIWAAWGTLMNDGGKLGASRGLLGCILEAPWMLPGYFCYFYENDMEFLGTFNCDIIDGPYCKMYRRGGSLKKGGGGYHFKAIE